MLDTICNVFGGMILMAVLVVIMTRASVARIPSDDDPGPRLAARKLKFEIQRVKGDIAEQQRLERELNERYSATVSPDTDKLVKKRRAFLDSKKQASDRLEQLKEDQDDADQRSKHLERARGDIEKGIDAKRAELAALEVQAKAEKARARRRAVPQEEVRLPFVHESKSPRQQSYVVEGNRVYLYPTQCTVVKSQDATSASVAPRINDGFFVEAKGNNVGFLRTLNSVRPSTHKVALFVAGTSTSFESFQAVRRLVVSRGFDCGYSPYDSKRGLIVVFGAGVPVQ